MQTALRTLLATLFIALFSTASLSAQVTIFQEDFEGMTTGTAPAPAWTATVNTPPGPDGLSPGWLVLTAPVPGWGTVVAPPNGPQFAMSEEFGTDSDQSLDFLETPAFDLTGYTSAELTFNQFFNGSFGSEFNIEISVDNGVTFTPLISPATTGNVWALQTIDLTPYIGNTQVVLRFHHDDTGTWASGVGIDDVLVTGTVPGLDLAISDQISPDPATAPDCSGSPLDVILEIENTNTVVVTSATIDWTINGVAQTAFNYTGTLNNGDVTNVTLGTGVTINAGDVIEATITSVNGGPTSAQTSTANDELTFGNPVALAGGTYTVGPTGDFPDVGTVFTLLEDAGICGPVVFQIESGTYNVSESLAGPIAGASLTNTIEFTSQTGNASDVILAHDATSATDNYIMEFLQVDFLAITNLTFRDDDLTDPYSRLVSMPDDYDNITIGSNVFLGDSTANVAGVGLDAAYTLLYMEDDGNINDNVSIINNSFSGGGVAIWDDGSSGHNDHLIQGNTIRNFSHLGLYLYNQDNVTVRDNEFIVTQAAFDGTQAMEASDLDGGLIEENYVYFEVAGTGLDVNDLLPATGVAQFFNNAVTINVLSGTSSSEAIIITNSDFVDVFHNSAYVLNSTAGTSHAFEFTTSAENNVFENNLGAVDGSGTVYIVGDNLSVVGSDYNVYFAAGGANIANWNGTVAATLADLQAANSLDANSVSTNPNFVAVDSLIPTNPGVQLANPIAGITTDILGDTRDAAVPSAGAYEYRFVPGLDLELTSASHPALTSPYCGAAGDLSITITNTLATDITSATISGSYNGGPLPFPPVNYSPGTPLTTGNSETILIAPGVAPANGDSIAIFITDVNGGGVQDDETNDTLTFVVTYGLDGIYTIDPAGAGDYLTLTEAFDDMEVGGLCGPTELQFVDGTHTTNASLDGPIGGLDATNTLTITSQSGDPALTTLEFNPATLAENFVIRLDQVGHTTISSLTLEEAGNDDDFSTLILLIDVATGNTITENIFNGDPTATGTTAEQAIIVVTDAQEDLTVTNNTFNDASVGLVANNGDKVNTLIDGNTFVDQEVVSVLFDNATDATVTNNTVTNTASGFYPFVGLQLGGFNTAGTIANNRVETDRAGFGMFFDYLNSATVVSNNVAVVGDVNGGAGNPTVAIDVFWGDGAEFYHNTGVVTAATDPESAGYRDRGGSFAYNLENNIFVNLSANGFAYVNEDGSLTGGGGGGTSDFNAYYAPNTNLADWDGTVSADLAALQTANGTDASSVEVDPAFVDVPNFDVNVCEPSLAMANPIASVTNDIDGNVRDAATPTAGAQEGLPAPPASPFLGADSTICAGANTVIGVASAPGLTYSWNTGPTPTLSEQTIAAAGTYELTISSVCGTEVDEIVITELAAATAGFTFAQGATKFDYDFTNTSTGVGLNYSWDFGDGSPASTLTNPSHTYSGVGSYIVELSVTDTCGGAAVTFVDTINIDCDPLSAGFNSSQGATKFDFDFVDASTGDVETWEWDFGDGNIGIGPATSHTYGAIGTYNVTLTVTDSCGNVDFFTAPVTVDCDPLAASFTSAQGATNLDYNFTDASTGDVESWAWDFGDGNTDVAQNPSHTYTAAGTYTVELTVTDSCGNTDVSTISVTAGTTCGPLAVAFTSAQGATKYDYDFTDASTGSIDTSAASTAYSWDFGDGNTSTLQDPSHTYSSIGTYTATLTVTDSCGNSDVATETIVIDCDPLAASFTSAQGATNLDYNFTDASTGDVESWAWDFGDGNTDVAQSPSHTYTAAGTYTVELTVTDSCGNTDVSTISVTAGTTCGPLAVAFTSAQGATKYDYDFTDASTGSIDTSAASTAYSWDFGDGNTSTLQDPSHTYSSIGTYTATLTVTDSCGNSDVATETIVIDCDPLAASFTSAQGATNLDYNFTDASTGDVESWAWDFGDGNTDVAQSPSHTYTAAGSYTVELTVTDSCGNTDVTTITVAAGTTCDPLAVAFTSAQGATKYDYDFTDASTGSIDTSAASTAYSWDFGDGNTSTLQDPSHTYSSIGTYTATLTVTDSCGNSDVVTETIVIDCDPLVASFTSAQGATNLDYNFTDASTGDVESWAWDFGDGNTAVAQSPTHTYTAAGTYTVELTVTDSCGNTDVFTETINAGINCDPLVVSFTASLNDLDATFTDGSTGSIDQTPGTTAYDWDFGDGNTSGAQDPNHTYGADGTYTVTLTVTDSCGNTDTFTEVLVVTSGSAGCPPLDLDFTVSQIAANNFSFVYDGTSIGFIDSYSWSVNGQTFSGDSINFTFPDTGTYDIELIVTDTCGDSDTLTKTLTVQIDSRADLIDAGLSIYPNPASDFVNVTFETPVNGGEVVIYNMTGQIILRESLDAATTAYTLQLQDVSEGVYLIRVTEQGTPMSERKLIIR